MLICSLYPAITVAPILKVVLVQIYKFSATAQVCTGAGGVLEGGDRLGDGRLRDGPPVLHHHVREAPRHSGDPRGGVALSQGLILPCICVSVTKKKTERKNILEEEFLFPNDLKSMKTYQIGRNWTT